MGVAFLQRTRSCEAGLQHDAKLDEPHISGNSVDYSKTWLGGRGTVAKKFVVAMMMHETNTFSPLPTPIESFARAGALAGPAAIKEVRRHQHLARRLHRSGAQGGRRIHRADGGIGASLGPGDQGRLRADDDGHRRRDQEGLRRRAARPAWRHGRRALRRRRRRTAQSHPQDRARRADRGRARFPHPDDRRHDQGRHHHHRLSHLSPHRHGRHRAPRRPHADAHAGGRGRAQDGVGQPADHEQLAGPHALARADEDPDGHGQPGRGHRPGAERLGVRRLPAGRHPSPGALLGDRLRQAHGRGRGPAEQDPRYGVGEARRLPVPSRAAVGPGGARQVARTAARRHGRSRRQHRLGRHAGRHERDRGGDEAGPRGRLRRPDLRSRPASSR